MFTPLQTTIGAVLLHISTTRLLFDAGAILGASGLLRQLLKYPHDEVVGRTTRLWFFSGMTFGTTLIALLAPASLPTYPSASGGGVETAFRIFASALLTGWGTKHCGGCTSGHMLCGIGRLSPRSFLATAIFFPAAVITFHLSNPTLKTAACLSNSPCYVPTYPTWPGLTLVAGAAFLFLSLSWGFTVQSTSVHQVYGLSGFTFAIGLLISGMADPAKVQSFFAIQISPIELKQWDTSLLLVILFAVVPNIINIRLRGLQGSPRLANRYSLPTKSLRDVDLKFVLGAVAFGVSWGYSGICPGPAIVRSILQPKWGAIWLAGFRVGSLDILGT